MISTNRICAWKLLWLSTLKDRSIHLYRHVATQYAGQLGEDGKSKSSSKSLSRPNAGQYVYVFLCACVCVCVCVYDWQCNELAIAYHICQFMLRLAEELTMAIHCPFTSSKFFKQEIRIVFIKNVNHDSYNIYMYLCTHIWRPYQSEMTNFW